MEPRVIYEDNHVIVVVKPFGMPSQEDESGDYDMLCWVKDYVKVKYHKPGEVFIGLLHRLDRVAGGLMVFARTSKSASRLSDQIRSRTFKKRYYAVVAGQMSAPQGRLADYLLKNEKNNVVSVVSPKQKGAKEARLDYDQLQTKEGKSLIQVELETGRSHQIRVQFSSRGCPIIGDMKYGSKEPNPKAIALWSCYLAFEHPTKKEWMEFYLQPPMDYPWNLFRF